MGLIAREIDPADEAAAIEWTLLTNRPINEAADAREVVGNYACRWMIEEYPSAA